MSEECTQNFDGGRSFEERVFARFDAMDARLNGLTVEVRDISTRLERLEAKQYDTKPIWERALKEIAETRQEVAETKNEVKALRQEVAETKRELKETRKEVRDVRMLVTDTRHEMSQRLYPIEKAVSGIEADVEELNDRVETLEAEHEK